MQLCKGPVICMGVPFPVRGALCAEHGCPLLLGRSVCRLWLLHLSPGDQAPWVSVMRDTYQLVELIL